MALLLRVFFVLAGWVFALALYVAFLDFQMDRFLTFGRQTFAFGLGFIAFWEILVVFRRLADMDREDHESLDAIVFQENDADERRRFRARMRDRLSRLAFQPRETPRDQNQRMLNRLRSGRSAEEAASQVPDRVLRLREAVRIYTTLPLVEIDSRTDTELVDRLTAEAPDWAVRFIPMSLHGFTSEQMDQVRSGLEGVRLHVRGEDEPITRSTGLVVVSDRVLNDEDEVERLESVKALCFSRHVPILSESGFVSCLRSAQDGQGFLARLRRNEHKF